MVKALLSFTVIAFIVYLVWLFIGNTDKAAKIRVSKGIATFLVICAITGLIIACITLI